MERKKVFYIIAAVIMFASFTAYSFIYTDKPTDAPKYVGAEKCAGACHKSESQGNQYGIWKGTKHSKAFETLTTEAADKIVKEKGILTPASESPECLKCHTTQSDASSVTESFNAKDGVQCETCHGPGSEYKTISIMKDKEKAVSNGLVIHTEKEIFCIKCHNAESPTFTGFSYEVYWDKIKHMKPAK